MKLILANPRGFCAGVDRAIMIVEQALELFGAPLYVRHEIVHNRHIVADFVDRGVVFVETLEDVPPDSILIFSAHGVSQQVVTEARARNLQVIDATCPLVTKVHMEAARYARNQTHILLVGHAGHAEVLGTMGQVPATRITLVEDTEQAHRVTVPAPENVALLTQTPLSVDETAAITAILARRFPALQRPGKQDICYATQNRQDAVKAMAPRCDVLLVVGSPNSSNANRLVEVAQEYGAQRAYLIDGPADLLPHMTFGANTVGLSAGASTPEHVVQAVINALAPSSQEAFQFTEENVHFGLPASLRRAQQQVA